MASQDKHLGVSTVGNRKYKTSDGSLEQATHRLLKHVEHHSSFFDQVEPYTLPSFEPSGTLTVAVETEQDAINQLQRGFLNCLLPLLIYS